MGSADLHSILRSLCFNSHWKYAVFWKLKHRARMVLTWEDAYYENSEQHDPSGSKCFGRRLEDLHGGHRAHDPLELAVAKMSYHVYSLGEGIIGQVAVTGKHQWIFADENVRNSFSSFEFADGWRSQFLAGIRTIVVVAVAPYGVVQLGSMNEVVEDMKLVNHINDVFLALQDTPQVTCDIPYTTKNKFYWPDTSIEKFCFGGSCSNSVRNLDKLQSELKELNDSLPLFPSWQKQNGNSSRISSLLGSCKRVANEEVNKHEALDLPAPANDAIVKLHHLRSNSSYLESQNQIGISSVIDQMCGGKTGVFKDLGGASEHNVTPHSKNSVVNKNVCDVRLPSEKLEVDLADFPSDFLDSNICDSAASGGIDIYLNGVLGNPESSDMDSQKVLGECQAESSPFNTSNSFLNFSAGYELHEALGPDFLKRFVYVDCEAENTGTQNIVEMPEEVSISQMTSDTGPVNLLEAVVGNVCYSSSDVKSEKSVCKSVQSLLTTEKMPEPSQTQHTISSAGYLINQQSGVEEDAQNCSNSEVCGAASSKGFSSTCPNTFSEPLERRSCPAKNSKKRARPGENCRPRPRDRQLIQDRIKELRELVPSGSKCSIDSLLERTIKHMLFLESITKHADKLNKCAESKMHQKGTDTNYEQGSSWAMEVGGHLKVSSIIVENLNKNGQMLVEMLCEECSHFLEIAEAIRSLGLTILKGNTEMHGEKIWICFVVEGQNNRIMHRMDILWSLVQILQPKSTS